MPLITYPLGPSYQAHCDRCGCSLSGWYPTRALAVCAADRAGATVRETEEQELLYCAKCRKEAGGMWLDNLPRPPELREFYGEATI